MSSVSDIKDMLSLQSVLQTLLMAGEGGRLLGFRDSLAPRHQSVGWMDGPSHSEEEGRSFWMGEEKKGGINLGGDRHV